MRNRPIFIKVKKFVDAKGYTIQQIQNVTLLQVKNLLNLIDEQYIQYCLYADGIKRVLIRNIENLNKQQEINEMVDRFLLSGVAITTEEAWSAVESIFESRSK